MQIKTPNPNGTTRGQQRVFLLPLLRLLLCGCSYHQHRTRSTGAGSCCVRFAANMANFRLNGQRPPRASQGAARKPLREHGSKGAHGVRISHTACVVRFFTEFFTCISGVCARAFPLRYFCTTEKHNSRRIEDGVALKCTQPACGRRQR